MRNGRRMVNRMTKSETKERKCAARSVGGNELQCSRRQFVTAEHEAFPAG